MKQLKQFLTTDYSFPQKYYFISVAKNIIKIANLKNTNKIILTISNNWRLNSLNSIKLLSIKVKNVKKPIERVIINIKPINIFFLIKSNIM